MKRNRKRLNGVRLNGHKPTAARNKLPAVTNQYPNLVRRLEERVKFRLDLIEQLAMLGMDDREIADALDITKHMFTRWRKRHKSIQVVLQRGRVIASARVVDSLYKKANGFSVPEEKLFYSAKHNRVVRAQTRKYYPPDTVAQIFWLKNNRPEDWRDKKEIENSGPGSGVAIGSVKFVLVQPGKGGKSEEVIDADFKVLPGAGQEGREQSKSSKSSKVIDVEEED